MAPRDGRRAGGLARILLAVLHSAHLDVPGAAPVRQPAAWGAWQQFEDEGMLAVMDRGPALIDHGARTPVATEQATSTVSRWHCVAQLEQPELLLRQHEWDLNVGASVLVANTGCSSRLALLRAGLGRRVREANTRAVEIAQEARQQAHLPSEVAHHARGSTGSPRALLVVRLGTTLPEAPDGGNFRWPTASEEEQAYDEQLEVLANTGAEVLEVGPIGTIEHGNRAVTSAARSGLPIWLAVSAALHPTPSFAGQGDDGEPTFAVPELYDVVLREDPMQSLDEAIAMWIDVAKAAEVIDGEQPLGPGAKGTNVVGLIIHSSTTEMLPILKSVTAFDSSWPKSGFLGAYVDVVLPHGDGGETVVDNQKVSEQPLRKRQKRSNAEREVPKRAPHAGLGSRWHWQLKDGGGTTKSEAAFVAAAFEWWQAGATAVGGAATAGVTRSELRALAPLRRPRSESTSESQGYGGYLGLRDGVAILHRHKDDDDASEVPWWLGLAVPAGALFAWWRGGCGEATAGSGTRAPRGQRHIS